MSIPAPLTEAPAREGWDPVGSGKVRERYVPAGAGPPGRARATGAPDG